MLSVISSLSGEIMLKALLFLASALLLTGAGHPALYRDSSGRIAGRATQQGKRTVYRDGQGRIVGSSTTHGSRTVYRDASGRIKNTANIQGNRTVYRDGQGRYKGSGTPASTQPYRDTFGMSRGKQQKK
jgi:YD repeat-containing protein